MKAVPGLAKEKKTGAPKVSPRAEQKNSSTSPVITTTGKLRGNADFRRRYFLLHTPGMRMEKHRGALLQACRTWD